jgi:hypothetical protein
MYGRLIGCLAGCDFFHPYFPSSRLSSVSTHTMHNKKFAVNPNILIFPTPAQAAEAGCVFVFWFKNALSFRTQQQIRLCITTSCHLRVSIDFKLILWLSLEAYKFTIAKIWFGEL